MADRTGIAEPTEDDVGSGGQYWILRPEQLRCLTSPRRMDIVDRLAASGPLSIRELAGTIGAKPSALYHHITLLLQCELIVGAGHRLVNRRREELYNTPSRKMRLLGALRDPANREVMRELVSAQSRQTDRDFRRGIGAANAEASGKGRNLGFYRLVSSPDPKTLERINEHLAIVRELMWNSPARDDGLVSLAWVMAPIPGSGGDDAAEDSD